MSADIGSGTVAGGCGPNTSVPGFSGMTYGAWVQRRKHKKPKRIASEPVVTTTRQAQTYARVLQDSAYVRGLVEGYEWTGPRFGPRGGKYYTNSETGSKVYSEPSSVSGTAKQAVKAVGSAVGKVEHNAKAIIKAIFDRLPPTAQKIVSASYKATMAGYTVGRTAAEKAAKASGKSPEAVAQIGKTLGMIDLLASKGVFAGALAAGAGAGVASAAAFAVPAASLGYLAFSSAKNPKATLELARAAIRKVRSSVKYEPTSGWIERAAGSVGKDHDFWLACFASAMDATKGDVEASIKMAMEATKGASDQRGKPEQYQAGPHKFASTQFNFDGDAAKAIIAAAKRIPDSDLAGDGRESEPHVTVKYGLRDDDPQDVKHIAYMASPITVVLGKTSIFPAKEASSQRGGEQYDVVKIDVESPALHRLNARIAKLPHTDTHPKYVPHVTLAYVKAGEGKKYAGKSIPGVTGRKITLDSLVFSGKEGKRTKCPLTHDKDISVRTPEGHNIFKRSYFENMPTPKRKREPQTYGRLIQSLVSRRGQPEQYAFQFQGPRSGRTRTVWTKSDLPKSIQQSGAYQEIHATEREKRAKESLPHKTVKNQGSRVQSHDDVQKVYDRLQDIDFQVLRSYAHGLDVKGKSRSQIADKVRALLLLKATEKAAKKGKPKDDDLEVGPLEEDEDKLVGELEPDDDLEVGPIEQDDDPEVGALEADEDPEIGPLEADEPKDLMGRLGAGETVSAVTTSGTRITLKPTMEGNRKAVKVIGPDGKPIGGALELDREHMADWLKSLKAEPSGKAKAPSAVAKLKSTLAAGVAGQRAKADPATLGAKLKEIAGKVQGKRDEQAKKFAEPLVSGNDSVKQSRIEDLKPGHEAYFSVNGEKPRIGTVEKVNAKTVKFSGMQPVAKSGLRVGLITKSEEQRKANADNAAKFRSAPPIGTESAAKPTASPSPKPKPLTLAQMARNARLEKERAAKAAKTHASAIDGTPYHNKDDRDSDDKHFKGEAKKLATKAAGLTKAIGLKEKLASIDAERKGLVSSGAAGDQKLAALKDELAASKARQTQSRAAGAPEPQRTAEAAPPRAEQAWDDRKRASVSKDLQTKYGIRPDSANLLRHAVEKISIDPGEVMRVAGGAAKADGESSVDSRHIAEAIQYVQQAGKGETGSEWVEKRKQSVLGNAAPKSAPSATPTTMTMEQVLNHVVDRQEQGQRPDVPLGGFTREELTSQVERLDNLIKTPGFRRSKVAKWSSHRKRLQKLLDDHAKTTAAPKADAPPAAAPKTPPTDSTKEYIAAIKRGDHAGAQKILQDSAKQKASRIGSPHERQRGEGGIDWANRLAKGKNVPADLLRESQEVKADHERALRVRTGTPPSPTKTHQSTPAAAPPTPPAKPLTLAQQAKAARLAKEKAGKASAFKATPRQPIVGMGEQSSQPAEWTPQGNIVEGRVGDFPIGTTERGLIQKVSPKTQQALSEALTDPDTIAAMKAGGMHHLALHPTKGPTKPKHWTAANHDGSMMFHPRTAEAIESSSVPERKAGGLKRVIHHEAGHGVWKRATAEAKSNLAAAIDKHPEVAEQISKIVNIKPHPNAWDPDEKATAISEVHAELQAMRKYDPQRFANLPQDVRAAVEKVWSPGDRQPPSPPAPPASPSSKLSALKSILSAARLKSPKTTAAFVPPFKTPKLRNAPVPAPQPQPVPTPGATFKGSVQQPERLRPEFINDEFGADAASPELGFSGAIKKHFGDRIIGGDKEGIFVKTKYGGPLANWIKANRAGHWDSQQGVWKVRHNAEAALVRHLRMHPQSYSRTARPMTYGEKLRGLLACR